MFEEIVSRVLIRYLGDYVDGLDKRQLQISIFGGNVELQDLSLKPSALRKLNLPIVVKAGYIGKLTLVVPWSNLKNESVIVRVSRVLLIAGPNLDQRVDISPEEEDELRHQEKLEKLSQAEKHLESVTAAPEKSEGIWARLIEKVVDNIQVRIEHVHIRYEDSTTDPLKPFSVGLTLESIDAFSTDENWFKKFLDKEHSLIHKIVELKNLAVYWNHHDENEQFLHERLYRNHADLEHQLDDWIWKDDIAAPQNQYILHPVSGKLKLRWNKEIEPNENLPKYTVDLVVDQVALGLDEAQYQNLIKVLAFFVSERRIIRARREFVEEPQVLAPEVQKHYLGLYIKYKKQNMSAPEREEFDKLERKLTYENIWSSRLIGQAQLAKDKEKDQSSQTYIGQYASSTYNYVSSWLWTKPEKEKKEKEVDEEIDYEKLRADFLKTIEYDEMRDYTKMQYPDAYVRTVFRFTMHQGSIEISAERAPIIELGFNGFSIWNRSRPGSMSSTIDISLDRIVILDHHTQNSAYGVLLTPSTSDQAQAVPVNRGTFFKMALDVNPPQAKDTSLGLTLDLMPSDVVFNRPLIDRLIRLFSVPLKAKDSRAQQAKIIHELEDAAKNQIQEFTDASLATVDEVLKKKERKIHIKINAFAPNIVVPEDITKEDTTLLVASLGFLSIRSNDEAAASDGGYDEFLLSMKALQLTFVDPSERAFSIVDKFDIALSAQLERKAGKRGHDSTSRIKVFGDMPALSIHLSAQQLKKTTEMAMALFSSQIHGLDGAVEMPTPIPVTPLKPQLVEPEDDIFGGKSKKEISSPAPNIASPTAESPSHLLAKLEAHFTLKSVTITAFSERQNLQLIRVEFSQIVLGATMTSQDLRVTTALSTFTLHDLTGLLPPLATSAGDLKHREFVQIDYAMTLRSSAHAQAGDQLLNVAFNTLNLTSNRKTILEFVDWLGEAMPRPRDDRPFIPAAAEDEELSPRIFQNSTKVVVRVAKVGLRLYDEVNKVNISDISLDNTVLQFTDHHQSRRIKGSLGALSIIDLRPRAHYVKILVIRKDQRSNSVNLVNFHFHSTRDNRNRLLRLQMSSIRVVFVKEFMRSLLDHFQNFRHTKKILEKSVESAEKLRADLVDPASLFKLEILVSGPQIVFPRDAKSREVIVADLGQIAIHNAFKSTKSDIVVQDYMISINAMHLRSTEAGSDEDRSRRIVQDIDVIVDINLPRNDFKHELPGASVSASISSVDVRMTDVQYKLLLVVVSNVAKAFEFKKDDEDEPPPPQEPSSTSSYLNSLLSPSKRDISTSLLSQKYSPWTTAQVKVFLKAVSLQVFSSEYEHGHFVPVAVASVGDLQFVMQTRSDGSSHLEFGLGSITVDDQRPHATHAYRRLLAPREKKRKEAVYRQLKLALVSTPLKSSLRIMLNRTRGIILADAIIDIVSFFLAPLRSSDNPFASAPQPVKQPVSTPEANTLASDISNIAPSAFELSLAISDPEILFLQDPSTLDSKALVVKSRFLIRMSTLGPKMYLMGLVKNFEVYTCTFSSEKESMAPIIHPWDFHVKYAVDRRRSKISCRFLPLQFVVSYQDLLLAMDIANQLAPLATIGGPSQAPPAPKDTMANEKLYAESIASKGRPLELSVRTSGLEVMVIDDSYGKNVPLIQARVDRLEGRLLGTTDRPLSAITAEIGLSIRSYNPRAAHWDTLISDWFATGQVSFYHDDSVKVMLVSKETLNVSVTKIFVDTVLRTGQAWREEYEKHTRLIEKTHSRPVFDPYIIRNDTGAPLFYSISDEKRKRRLSAGKTQSLLLPGVDLSKLRFTNEDENSSLNVDIPPFGENIAKLPLDKVGVYSIRPNIKNEQFKVIYSIAFEEGSRLLSFHGEVQLESGLDHDISVFLKSTATKRKLHFVLPSKGSKFVPLEWLLDPTTTDLLIRPYDDSGEEPTGPFMNLAALIAPPHDTAKSEDGFSSSRDVDADAAPSPFIRTAFADPYLVLVANAKQQIVSVKVAPPIVVENLLPVAIDVRLTDYDTGEDIIASAALKKGELLPVNYVHHRRNTVLLRIKLEDFDWCSPLKINAPSSAERETVFRLKDARGRVLNLHCAYDLSGNRLVSVYCKYWIYNRSGLRVLYLSDAYRAESSDPEFVASEEFSAIGTPEEMVNVFYDMDLDSREWYQHPHSVSKFMAKPFLYSPDPKDVLGNYLSIKIANSRWSHPFLVDTVGWAGTISVEDAPSQEDTFRFSLGVYVEPASKRFYRTKVITIAPRYVLVNNMDRELSYKQQDTSHHFTLRPKETIPFHWIANHPRRLRITLGDDCQWSGGLKIDDLGKYALNIRNNMNEIIYLARIEVKVEKATSFVIFNNEDPDFPPYRIENCTPLTISIYQKEVRGKMQKLRAFEAQPYAWEEPSKPRLLVVELKGDPIISKEFSLDKIKTHSEPMITSDGTKLRTEIIVDGPTRVFRIVSGEFQGSMLKSLKSPGSKSEQGGQFNKSPTKAITMGPATTKSTSLEPDRKLWVTVDLEGVGVSLINDVPKELFYLTLQRIGLEFTNGSEEQTLDLTLGRIQLDNQLRNAIFPIVLSPARDSSAATKFLQVAYVRSNFYKDITFFNSFSLNLQGLDVDVSIDETFLNDVISFFMSFVAEKDDIVDDEWDVSMIPIPAGSLQQRKLYFEAFMLGPLKVNLGLRMKEGTLNDSGLASLIGALLKSGMASLDNVPIILNALVVKHPFTTPDELLTLVKRHYSTQVIQQFYKMVGYIDILGSPISLFSNFGTGLYDFFYEPTQALISNPQDLLKSLKKGTSSLVGKSLYGIFNSVSKISGSIGKVVATLSEDRGYIKERQKRTEPRHLGDAIAIGAHDLGYSLADGLYGVVHEPYEGYQDGGVLGLLNGIRRGTMGVVFLPALGAIDLLTTTTTGARNTATLLANPNLVFRARPPRCFRDFSIPDYQLRPALGQFYLWALPGYGRHMYQWHLEHDVYVYILSNTALFCLNRYSLHVLWTLFYEDINISKLARTEQSVIIYLNQPEVTSAQSAALFAQQPEEAKLVNLSDAAMVTQFIEQLRSVIASEFMKINF